MTEDPPTVFGAKATDQIAKTVREVSRRMMNARGERGRWQWHGGDALNITHGIVTANLGCGYYTIEKGTWAGDMEDAGVGLGSDYGGTGDCDVCEDIVGAGTESCGITLTYPPCQVDGTGVYVTAYDEASGLIPLVVGTSCKMINMGDVDTYTGDPVWQILRGVMEHVVKYEEDGRCCPLTGIYRTERKRANILIGRTCDWVECEPC